MKGLRYVLLVCSAVILMMTLTGCISGAELKDRTIIKMVGVDLEGEDYLLTLLRFSPKGSLEEGSSQEQVSYLQTRGRSLSDAIDKVSHYTGNEIFLGNTSLLVIGKEAAKKDIEKCMSFFNANHEVNPELYLTLASSRAQDVIQVQSRQNDAPTQLKSLIKQGQENGLLGRPTLRDVMNRLQSDCSEPYLPMIEAVDVGEGKQLLKISGMGICKDGKLKATLPIEESRGVLWATNELNHAVITVDFGKEESSRASVTLNDSKSRVQVNIQDGAPQIYLSIQTNGSLNEINSSNGAGAGFEELKEIQQKAAEKIEETVEKTISKVFFQEKSDVFRYSEFIKKQQPAYWKAHQEEWDEMIDQCQIYVEARCKIEHLGLEAKHRQG